MGCKDMGVEKQSFVGKTQFLYRVFWILLKKYFTKKVMQNMTNSIQNIQKHLQKDYANKFELLWTIE